MGFFLYAGALVFGWLAASRLAPSIPESRAPGTELTSAKTDSHIPKIYGKVQKITGKIAFKETNDVDGDSIDNDLLHIIVVWGEACESIDEVYIDDIPWDDGNSLFFSDSNERVVHVRNFPDGMQGYFDSALAAAGWRDTDELRGKACSYIRMEFTGEEESITAEPQIKADLTGTTHSNPATALKDYLTNPMYGKGLSDSYLDLASFTAAETLCNSDVEEVTGGGVMRKLFTCNVKLDTENSVLENVNTLLKPMRAWLPVLDGKLTLIIEQDSAPVSVPILEKDILELGRISNGSKSKRYNRISVTYYDPAADGTKQEAVYPPKDSQIETDLLAEDNGVLLEDTVDLPTCRNYFEALEFAKTFLEVSREQLRTQITLPKWATIYQVGDIVPVSHSFPGWNGKLFRIESTEENREEVKLSVREHQPYVYDFFGQGTKPNLPDTGYQLGTPSTPTDLQIEHFYDNFKQVRASWVSTAQRFDYQVVDANAGDLDGTVLESSRIGRNYVDLQGFALGTYNFRVRAIGGMAQHSGWAEIQIVMQEPGIPTAITVNPSNFEIEVLPTLAGADSATSFEYTISLSAVTVAPSDIRGPAHAYTFTGLTANTEYKVWVRSHSPLGVSAWATTTVLTLNEGTGTSDFIDDRINVNIEPIQDVLDYLDGELGGIDEILENVSQDITEIVDRESVEQLINLEDTARKAQIEIVNNELDTINNVTIPAVDSKIQTAQSQLDTLNDTTIPAIDSELDTLNNTTIPNINSDLDTLNNTTIPNLQYDLDAAENDLLTLNGKFPITSTDISDSAISTPKLAANAVTAAKIIAGAVTTAKMIANSINGDRIAANTLAADKIVANSITTNQIAALGIAADRIVANSITTDQIASRGIAADRIVANSLTAGEIAALTITAAEIAARTITGEKIVSNTITANEIAALTITAAEISAGTITSNEIATGTINAINIAADAITTNKIAALAVTAAEIAASTITGDKIAANTILADNIASNTITANEIAALSITADEIAANAITSDKITANVSLSAPSISGGNMTLTGTSKRLRMDPVKTNFFWFGDDTVTTESAANADIALSDTGITINGGSIVGADVKTAAGTASRVEVGDDGTYMLWAGDNTKSDANATFFIKKDGTGFIKGEFFQGQIARERFAESTTSTVTVTGHLSAGKDIYVTATVGFLYSFTSSTQPGGGGLTLDYTLKRGTTTIKSGTLTCNRYAVDPQGEPGVDWFIQDTLNATIQTADTAAVDGTTYSYTLELTPNLTITGETYDLTLKTNENLTG